MPQRKLKQRKMKQAGEKIFFEEVLTLWNLPPNSSLILPPLFVKEHGGNICSVAELRSVESGKSYTVKITVTLLNDEPTCFFSGGWKAFTVANELVVNDKLTFELVAPSTFEVSIKRRGESSTSSVLQARLQDPVPAIRSQNIVSGRVKAATNGRNKSKEVDVAPVSSAEISHNKSEEPEEPDVAPETPQVPFVTNNSFFEQMVQEMLHQLLHQKKEDCLVCMIDSMKGKEIPEGSVQMSFLAFANE